MSMTNLGQAWCLLREVFEYIGVSSVEFNAALRPQRLYGLLWTGSPGFTLLLGSEGLVSSFN